MDKSKHKKMEITGAIITCVAANLFHFIYAWSGNNVLAGIIAPINESVWEHCKMIYFPILFFAIIEYFVLKPDFKRFFAVKTASLAFSTVVTICFFYTYTGMFGTHSLVIDIICTYAWVVLAAVISYKLYWSEYALEKYMPLFCVLFFGQLAMMLLFTSHAPHIPLFEEAGEHVHA